MDDGRTPPYTTKNMLLGLEASGYIDSFIVTFVTIRGY